MKNDQRDIPTEPYLKAQHSRWSDFWLALQFLVPTLIVLVVAFLTRGCHR